MKDNSQIISANGHRMSFDQMVQKIKDYKQKHKDCKIIVGCDSQKIKKRFSFATAIAVIDQGNGGIFFIRKQYRIPHKKFGSIKSMISWKVYEQANYIYKMVQELQQHNIALDQKITHHDLSYNGLSSEHIAGINGWMKSMGYNPVFKPYAVIASGLANIFSKT